MYNEYKYVYEYIGIIYLLVTIVSKIWPSSSIFLIINILYAISHGFKYPIGHRFVLLNSWESTDKIFLIKKIDDEGFKVEILNFELKIIIKVKFGTVISKWGILYNSILNCQLFSNERS